MSIKIMNRVWESSSHEGSTLLVLLSLADHASDDGVCYPGIPRLATKARISERHTKRLITELEDSGEIYADRTGGRRRTSLYFVVLGFNEEEISQTLAKRFEMDHLEASKEARQIIERRDKKGDTQDTLSGQKGDADGIVSDEKGDAQGQETVTPASEKVTPASEKGDIAVSPEPSLTVIQPSVRNQEEETFFPENSKSASPSPSPFQKGDDQLTIAAKCAAGREAAGSNYAIPAPAGGSFALGDLLVTAACDRLGRSEPEGKKHDHARAFFEKALRTEGLLQGNAAMLTGAVNDWLDPRGEYAFFRSQYDLNPKHELALRHFGIVLSKAKKQTGEADARRARDVEAAEASLAALEQRQAARPPPPQDDKVGYGVKVQLEAQMGLNEFRQYVAPACFTCDDGILHVAAPDEFTQNWLESNLGLTIKRALAGVAGGPTKVAFEVGG